jgi:hypothetical protein
MLLVLDPAAEPPLKKEEQPEAVADKTETITLVYGGGVPGVELRTRRRLPVARRAAALGRTAGPATTRSVRASSGATAACSSGAPSA